VRIAVTERRASRPDLHPQRPADTTSRRRMRSPAS
jgi:hypothetical protein